MLSGGKRALQTCNGRWLSSHTFRDLRLGKPCFLPCFQKLVEQLTFLALDALDFLADARPAQQLRDNLIMRSHL